MVADGMLTRKRYREVPPRVDYELTERARDLMPILGELARWGYEWAWSSPRAAENVDVCAIFRLAPGLIRSAGGESGTVELTVQRDGDTSSYSLTLSSDGASVHERAAERPDARIAGDTAAWISAFSPDGDRGGLEIRGDRELAGRVLEGLASSAQRSAAHPSASAAA
jgi:hypothetical protein